MRAEAGGWYPLIIVRHRVTDPGTGALTSPLARPHPSSAASDPGRKVRAVPRDLLRLAHLHRMLAAADLGADAAWGGVVGLDADCVVWTDLAAAPGNEAGRSPLDTYDRRFADRLAVATAARVGAPALAEPSRITECRRCPWWPVCEADLRRVDDVSLVVRGEDALRLRGRGVTTVRALAALDPRRGLPEPAEGASDDTGLATDLREAVALARAWRSDVPLVRRVVRPDVPARSGRGGRRHGEPRRGRCVPVGRACSRAPTSGCRTATAPSPPGTRCPPATRRAPSRRSGRG